MLSEEDKKAIKMLEYLKEHNTLIGFDIEDRQKLSDTVLNLITKLQKEIEYQKEKRENQKVELAVLNEKQKDMNKLINTVKTYKGQFKRQEEVIRQLKKENKEKDRQIDLTAKFIKNNMSENKIINEICVKGKCNNEECHEDDLKECIKQYFERKVRDERN